MLYTHLFCTVRLAAEWGEASSPVSLCACGLRPQRDGFSDERNEDVLEVPPTRDADRPTAVPVPEPGRGIV